MKFRNVAFASTAAVIAALAIGTGTAQASGLLSSHDIEDNGVRSIDIHDGGVHHRDLSRGVQAKIAQHAKDGVDGKDGKDGIAGLYYVTATYGTDVANNPNVSVNEGAIATVACKDPADHAVAGGVQTLGIDGGRAAAVASSFPGRMDWDTNTPKANRFDGWIVQFDARQAPVKANIWVTCATGTTISQFEVPVS